MTTRDRLPARRDSDVFDLEFNGHRYRIQAGKYPDKRLGEVFIDAQKVNSSIYSIASDGAVLISLLLQHGVRLTEIKRTLSRNPDGSPGSIFGAVLARLAAETEVASS